MVKTKYVSKDQEKINTSVYMPKKLWEDFELSAKANGLRPSQVLLQFAEWFVSMNQDVVKQWQFKNALTELIQASNLDKDMVEKFFKPGVKDKDFKRAWESLLQGVDRDKWNEILIKRFGTLTDMYEGIPVLYTDEKKEVKKPKSLKEKNE